MPYYYAIKHKDREEGNRIVDYLLLLREQLRRDLPRRTVRDTLLLATWNIRDFDSNKFRHGPRLPESFYYIAEIISSFDLVAIQEVNDDLSALREVMRILGSKWDYIVTDVTVGRSGNRERMGFVYDTRKVSFQHIAGEIVLPKGRKIDDERQFARTPFLVAFQSHWFKFSLCTVHLYYGADSGEKLQRRIEEIDSIAEFFARRAGKDKRNYILLGDFNIVQKNHETMKALTRHGYHIDETLRDIPSNMREDKHYDQIAFLVKDGELLKGDSDRNAGVLNFYDSVFPNDEARTYHEAMDPVKRDEGDENEYYRNVWRTFQMSDHLPMWVELKIDFSDMYLGGLRHNP